jgi:hypothetical protein
MPPGKYDLSLYRGDTGEWRFVLWEDPEMTIPVDLTGVMAKSEIRDKSGGTLIVDLGCTVIPPNSVDVVLAAADSLECPSKGVWDLQLTYADSSVHTVIGGDVTTTADVTDSVPAPATEATRR